MEDPPRKVWKVRRRISQALLGDGLIRDRSRVALPMADIMWFAIYSGRRESEICRLRWTDNDVRTRTGLVRDLKHPQHTLGTHRRFRYTNEGWQIALRQPRTSAWIFPYTPRRIQEAFYRACCRLGIDNLHFHDLRHEATSRLFERGYEIHEVQQFTLHSSWEQLQRYTHLRPEHIPDLPYPSLGSLQDSCDCWPAGTHIDALTAAIRPVTTPIAMPWL